MAIAMQAKNAKLLAHMRIFTYTYHPFIMGGSVWQPEATMARPIEVHQVGDIGLALFQNPITKLYHVAELQSGGLVGIGIEPGLALASCIMDINTGDRSIIPQQIEDAKKKNAGAPLIDSDLFWQKLARAKQ